MKFARFLVLSAFALTALAAAAPAQENAWVSHGPTGVGTVNDVVVGDSVAYAATPNGVIRSNDAGLSWQQSGLAGESISQVLVASGGAVVLARTVSGILYASRDGADFWSPVPGLFPVTLVAIDPGQPSTVYAGVGNATIWKSTDAGSSWGRLSATPGGSGPLAFAFDSRAIYVWALDTLENRYKFYDSSDGGASWAATSSPIPYATALATGVVSGFVYVGGPKSLCRSADSAATWTCSDFPENPIRIVEVPGDRSGAAPRILATSPGGVYVSSDAGSTWARVRGEVGTIGDNVSVASDASGSVVLAGTGAAGIFRSQDRGETWTPASAGLRSSGIVALALDPEDPSTVWAAGNSVDGKHSGLFRSADAGLTWSLGNGPPSSFDVLAIDPEHPSTLFAGGGTFDNGSAVYRSDDGGAQWTRSVFPGPFHVNALALDPRSPERVWAASHDGLFRSDDGARSFSRPPAVAQEVYSILFDGKHPGTMYAGSYFDVEPGYYAYPFGGSIFTSLDSGASWTRSSHDFGSPVFAIATDPFHDGVLYAGTSAGVLRSADGGSTWTGPGQGLPSSISLRSLVADPVRPGRLYASTDSGVYRTLDGAQSWQWFSAGLGSLQVLPLVISPDGKWLHAGTDGGGIFELDLESSQTCFPTETRLCLVVNRYAVELLAARVGEAPNTPGAAQPLGERSGYFSLPFATGDAEFPEVVVKMLAEGTFGGSGAPIFYSSLTTLPYVLTVTDKLTGRVETYASDPDTPLCGGTHLPFTKTGPYDYDSMGLLPLPEAAGETALQLLGGRFSVTLHAHDPRSGRSATGTVMVSGDRFGFFSLPEVTGDPQFPEVAVKMVDFRAVNGKFWFFYTGLTSLDYTLTVTDSVTGAIRTYASTTPFCGAADTKAFTDSLPNPSRPDLNGFWSGAISFPSDCFTCRSREEIQVTLSQVGDAVTGHFSTECLGNRELSGTLNGDQLTLDFSPISGTGSFTGSASSTSIHVEKNCDPWGYGDDHTMELDLSR